MGVLLFQILIDDLHRCLCYSRCILYADDMTIYVIGRSLKCLKVKTQYDLNCLENWLCLNWLKLNVHKTKSLLFNKEGLFPNIGLSINGETIETVSKFKFLGILIDNALRFQEHFTDLPQKLLKSSFTIRSRSQDLPRYCIQSLYFAYFHSNMTYCFSAWMPFLMQASQETLVRLQKRIIRSYCKVSFREHCMPLFRDECILTLYDHLRLENLSLISNFFICNENLHCTRNIGISVRRHKLSLVNRSFLCKSLSDWQQLKIGKDMISKSLSSFKQCRFIKNHMIDKY